MHSDNLFKLIFWNLILELISPQTHTPPQTAGLTGKLARQADKTGIDGKFRLVHLILGFRSLRRGKMPAAVADVQSVR